MYENVSYFIDFQNILLSVDITKTAYLRVFAQIGGSSLVEVTGLEPTASASRTQRSTKLSHTSKITKILYHIISTLSSPMTTCFLYFARLTLYGTTANSFLSFCEKILTLCACL